MLDYKQYSEDLLQDLYKPVKDYNHLCNLVAKLLFNINKDKDGSYFICKENETLIDNLKELVK